MRTVDRASVVFCGRTGKWAWVVRRDDGVVVVGGREATEREAWAEARDAARDHALDFNMIIPGSGGNRSDFRWSCAVTTVPARREDLLPRTLASMKAAGFGSPRLLVDGIDHRTADSYEDDFGLHVTARGPTPLRTWGNWLLGVYELYIRDPEAEMFAVFQDDAILLRNLRGYLDRAPCPLEGAGRGYMNLYTFPSNQEWIGREVRAGHFPPREKVGLTGRTAGRWYPARRLAGNGATAGGPSGKGAVGLVLCRAAVLDLLSSRHVVERPLDLDQGHRKIDGGIVTALDKAGWQEYVHDPSLVQHVGDVSTMGNPRHPKAVSFPGEGFDALDLLG